MDKNSTQQPYFARRLPAAFKVARTMKSQWQAIVDRNTLRDDGWMSDQPVDYIKRVAAYTCMSTGLCRIIHKHWDVDITSEDEALVSEWADALVKSFEK